MKKLVIFALASPLFFTGLIILAGALGALQSIPAVLRGFVEGCDDKPQPCWYGLVLGQMPSDEANRILKDAGYKYIGREREDSITWAGYFSPGVVTHNCNLKVIYRIVSASTLSLLGILLNNCRGIRLGDIVGVVGTPETVALLRGMTFKNETILIDLDYQDRNDETCLDSTPSGEIKSIHLVFPGNTLKNARSNTVYWHNFVPYSQYVKRDGLPSCSRLRTLP